MWESGLSPDQMWNKNRKSPHRCHFFVGTIEDFRDRQFDVGQNSLDFTSESSLTLGIFGDFLEPHGCPSESWCSSLVETNWLCPGEHMHSHGAPVVCLHRALAGKPASILTGLSKPRAHSHCPDAPLFTLFFAAEISNPSTFLTTGSTTSPPTSPSRCCTLCSWGTGLSAFLATCLATWSQA